MSGRVELIRRPVWRARWAARVPKLLLVLTVGILSVAGLRAALSGPDGDVAAPARGADRDLGAESFAEAFVRAYLTWDPERPERHERAVATFTTSELDAGAGLAPASHAQQVVWTAAASDRPAGRRRRIVTVAAQTSGRLYYLAVPVVRDRRGFLFVGNYPALVGPPPTNLDGSEDDEREVDDEGLRSVVERAVSNYLAGERRNLLADLDPQAVVSLPRAELRVESVDEVTWVGPRRVAARVEARGEGGVAFTLRYELGVVRRDRWYVRSIEGNPTGRRTT